ncbi:neutral zinc metallopeptidase [Nonomuraea sp. NPDC050556]|uniref:neutral zinc metallopeptidase n=1 Tax=Nonomuraea sp. NPDC050556 TaxID=3364369 RepID=UPI003787476B
MKLALIVLTGLLTTTSPALTHNKLYETGAMAPTACKLPSMPNRGHKAVSAHVNNLLTCLDTAWGKHLGGYGKPWVRYYTDGSAKFCGGKVGDSAPGAYCNIDHQIAIIVPEAVREYAPEVGFMLVMAHEYGHHIQYTTGMWDAVLKERFKDKKQLLEANRRYELQADCLAGVYIGANWQGQKRSVGEWGALMALTWAIGGEKGSMTNDHGSRENRASWFNKGFAAESPSVCNTWSAPSSKVA